MPLGRIAPQMSPGLRPCIFQLTEFEWIFWNPSSTAVESHDTFRGRCAKPVWPLSSKLVEEPLVNALARFFQPE